MRTDGLGRADRPTAISVRDGRSARRRLRLDEKSLSRWIGGRFEVCAAKILGHFVRQIGRGVPGQRTRDESDGQTRSVK